MLILGSGFVYNSGFMFPFRSQFQMCKIGIMVLSLAEHCPDTSVNTLRDIDTVGMKTSVSN